VFLAVLTFRVCMMVARTQPADWHRVDLTGSVVAALLGALLWGGIVYGIYPYIFGRGKQK